MTSDISFDLDLLVEQGFFSNLDYYFAKSMGDAFDGADPIILFSCALVSKALSQGHICINIAKIAGTINSVSATCEKKIQFPEFNIWIAALNASAMVSNIAKTPLVIDTDHRLFLAKYFDFQDRLAKNIAQRHFFKPVVLDEPFVEKLLDTSFDVNDPSVLPQKNAIKNALYNYFTIISGGPGTGKTFVSRLIQKIFTSCAKYHRMSEPKIICVAPTGKAASKMVQGSTIHSVLKPQKNGPGFYHCKEKPLFADVVIIDEASMIDIILLTRLFEAIPMTAKVIILGDKHQLASVQAGSVFSEICNTQKLLSNIFVLKYNFRSKGKSGIEKLAKAINEMDEDRVEDILISGKFSDIVFEKMQDKTKFGESIQAHILEGYRSLVRAKTVEIAIEKLNDFKILCAHNSGEYGTLQINHVCENILRSGVNFDIREGCFKQVIMVNTNDYKKGLFNGDTGILTDDKGEQSAFFRQQDADIRQFRVMDLPGNMPAFAITIHKSQGSEFETILILIPEKISPVMTRQLLYTGVTRAKAKVIIAGDIQIIKKAVCSSIEHSSGLSVTVEKHIHEIENCN